jgi:hypothetical protein
LALGYWPYPQSVFAVYDDLAMAGCINPPIKVATIIKAIFFMMFLLMFYSP